MAYYISSGVISTGITLNYDSMRIYSGGVANCTTVDYEGSMYIYRGGVANSTTVNYGGYMYITSGGVANSSIVNSSGRMYITSGGVANNTTIFGDWYYNRSGVMYISIGGVANCTTVNDWSEMYISSGGVANSTTVNSDGNMYITSGGVANSTTIKSGGLMKISSGGNANSITLLHGGILGGFIFNEDKYIDKVVDGSAVIFPNVTVIGNSMHITSGGVANSTTVNSGGDMFISSGGVANCTTVNDWGDMYISSGGVANSTTVNYEGDMFISSGGVANSSIVNSSGRMFISSGGVAKNTTVKDNGYMYISSGGVANSTTVDPLGWMYISSGGNANSIILRKGGKLGGFIFNEDKYIDKVVDGSAVIFPNVTIIGNSMHISSGGVANDTAVNGMCSMYIFSGGVANCTTVSGGRMYIASGGVANSTTISGGDMYIEDGGVANNTTVNSYGSMFISNCGVANSTTVKSGGWMDISSGGVADCTIVNSYGSMFISSGAAATQIVENGGYIEFADGANVEFASNTITGLILSNTSMTVHKNTIANETIISGGAIYIFDGVANDTTVNHGRVYVSSGGVANDITLSGANYSSTYMYINSGGAVYNATVNKYGTMYISSGGTASNTTVKSGSELYISSGGIHRGSLLIENEARVVTYQYGGVIIDFTLTSRTAEDDYLINNLSLISGAPTYTITVSADQKFGTYKLAQGAHYFTDTITIGDGTTDYGSLTVNGSKLVYNDTIYSLTKSGGDLLLEKQIRQAICFYSRNEFTSCCAEVSGATLVSRGGNNYMEIFSGGVANDTAVNGMCSMYIFSGGVANNTTLRGDSWYSAHMYIGSGGVANSTTVNIYGAMYISSGGVADNTIICSSGEIHITMSGKAERTTVNYGGSMYISNGATAVEITENGGYVAVEDGANVTFASNTLNNINVYLNTATVHSNTVANNTTVNNSGRIYIFSGGVANDTTVNEGGKMYISSGGVANSTTVNIYGAMYISSGGVADNTIICESGEMHIARGGKADRTTVNYGGSMYISNGATAVEITENGGYVAVEDGANVTFASNTLNNINVYSNTATVHSNTVANNITVNNSGRIYIFSGGVANDTTLSGGYYGDAFMYISSGGVANDTTVNYRGSMYISSGATAVEITENGGYVTVENGANVTFASNTISSFTLFSSAMTVHSNTVANNTSVTSYGAMHVYDGGVANGATLSFWGVAHVSSGGVMNSAGINMTGSMYISSGGVANDTTVNGGIMVISSGGIHGGSLNIAANAAVSAYAGSIIDFTVADRTANGDYLINDLAKISGAPTYTITVNVNQSYGVYKLAQGAKKVDGSILIQNGVDAGVYISVNQKFINYGNNSFALTQNNGELLLTVEAADFTPPEKPLVSANITTATNQNVVVSAVFANDSVLNEYRINNGDWKSYTGTITVKENCTVDFRSYDKLDNISEVTYIVNCIDKIAPEVEITGNAGTWTNKNVILQVSPNEEAVILYSFDKLSWLEGTHVELEKNATVYFKITDIAGNSIERSVIVDKIDKTAPVLTVSANTAEWTRDDIVLTASVNEESLIEYFNGTDWVAGKQYTVTANGSYTVRATDLAGNVTVQTISVDNIDRVAPKITIKDDYQDWTLLVADVTDALPVLIEYYNGTEWVVGNEINVIANGTYKFRATDAAGNVSQLPYYFNKISQTVKDMSVRPDWRLDRYSGTQYGYGLASSDVAVNTSVYASYFDVYGVANNTKLYRIWNIDGYGDWSIPSIMRIYNGGVANHTTVDQFCSVLVQSGGLANYTDLAVVSSYMVVYNGGKANYTTVNSGTELHVSGTADYTTLNYEAELYVWGTANHTTVGNRAYVGVEANGEINYTQISSGGEVAVWSGAANSTTVNQGAVLRVYEDGSATAIIENGGYVFAGESNAVFAENTFSGLILRNGSASLHSGTIAAHASVGDKGIIDVFAGGSAVNACVYSSGCINISSGGSVINAEVYAGGNMFVSRGATADSTTVLSGGMVTVLENGTVCNSFVENDGMLYISSGTHKDKLTIADDGMVFVESNAVIDFTIAGCTAGNEYLVNNLALIFGTPDFTITVADDQTAGVYYLAQNADNFTGTITITDGKNIHGTITVNGSDIIYKDNTYSLDLIDGNLTLNLDIDDRTPPAAPVASADITEATNGKVTVTAAFSKDSAVREYSFDKKIWHIYSEGIVFEQNGSVWFRCTDEAGNVSEITSYLVNNIDKTAPQKPSAQANITTVTNSDVTVTAIFSSDSVVREYSFDNKAWQAYSEGIVFEQNGSVYFRGIDAAGNVSEITSYLVNNIDKTAPQKPSAQANITTVTNSDVTVTAIFSSDSVVREYSFDNKAWQAYSEGIVFEQNGSVYFRGIDAAGNISQIETSTVNNIDKIAPVVNGSVSVIENGYSISFAEVDDASGIYQYKVKYSVDGKTYIDYPGDIYADYAEIINVGKVKRVQVQAIDNAGNESSWQTIIIPPINVDNSENLIFISSKFNEKTTGKKQNGVTLIFGENAFASLDDVGDTSGKTVVMVDSKNTGDYVDKETVAGAAVTPTVKETDNSYSYKATETPKGTLNISADTGSTEFIRFATVNITGAAVDKVTGGKSASAEDIKTTVDKKGTVTDTEKTSYTNNANGKFTAVNGSAATVKGYATVNLTGAAITELSGGNTKETFNSKLVDGETKDQKTISEVNDNVAAGSVTLKNGASVETLAGYSNVTLSDSTAGDITNFTSKDSKSDKATFDEAKNKVTRKVTLSHSETTAGTLKATNSTLGNVTGFATVTLKDVEQAGDFRRVDENGNLYSTVKETLDIKTDKKGVVTGTYSKTESFTRGGKITATGSTVGDIENFSIVTLDNTQAKAISNFIKEKVVTKGTMIWDNAGAHGKPEDYDLGVDDWDLEVTAPPSLNGSVTLKNGAYAESISNFKSVTMTGSEVGSIENVTKVTVNKGDSAIGSYIGTDDNDTFTIAKGAVLTADKINLGNAGKDTLAINGTLILTGTEVIADKFTGKGEIAVVDSLFDEIELDFANILNVGATAGNFRGTSYENADDTSKKAVKWDGSDDFNGWLGSWSGGKSGSDTIDYIKFKAEAGDVLSIDGNVEWTLLDKKGKELGQAITAAGEYTIRIINDGETSTAYTITLG